MHDSKVAVTPELGKGTLDTWGSFVNAVVGLRAGVEPTDVLEGDCEQASLTFAVPAGFRGVASPKPFAYSTTLRKTAE